MNQFSETFFCCCCCDLTIVLFSRWQRVLLRKGPLYLNALGNFFAIFTFFNKQKYTMPWSHHKTAVGIVRNQSIVTLKFLRDLFSEKLHWFQTSLRKSLHDFQSHTAHDRFLQQSLYSRTLWRRKQCTVPEQLRCSRMFSFCVHLFQGNCYFHCTVDFAIKIVSWPLPARVHCLDLRT